MTGREEEILHFVQNDNGRAFRMTGREEEILHFVQSL